MGQRLFCQESAMPTAHSSVMCCSYTKMLRILSIFVLHSAWDLLGKSKGKNVIMRVIWVFPLSGVCNFFSSCHWLTRKEEVSVLKWELRISKAGLHLEGGRRRGGGGGWCCGFFSSMEGIRILQTPPLSVPCEGKSFSVSCHQINLKSVLQIGFSFLSRKLQSFVFHR